MSLDMRKVVPAAMLAGEDAEDTALLRGMLERASQYLRSFRWCADIEEAYFGLGVGGVVAVFLFRIRPAQTGVDPLLWVVVGDVPSAYLVTDRAPSPACALEGYVELMT